MIKYKTIYIAVLALVSIYSNEAYALEVTINENESTCTTGSWCVSWARIIDEFSGKATCTIRIDDNQKNDKYNFAIKVTMGDEKGSGSGLENSPDITFNAYIKNFPSEMDFNIHKWMGDYQNAGYMIDNGSFNALPPTEFLAGQGVPGPFSGMLYAASILNEGKLSSLKKGNFISYKLSESLGVITLPLKGFTKAYNLCDAVIRGKAEIKTIHKTRSINPGECTGTWDEVKKCMNK